MFDRRKHVARSPASIAYSTLVASLDGQTLRRYPIVRGLSTYGRRFRVDPHLLRDETEAVWSALPLTADFELRCNIGNPLARIMYETGRFEAAQVLLRSLEAEIGGIPDIPRTSGEAYIARTLGCVCARSGRLVEAERYFRKGYFAISGADRVASRYSIVRAIIERLFDHRDDERRLADAAIDSAFAADMPVHVVCALGAAFGAWFAGEDDLFARYVRRFEERVAADGMRGFAHFCAAAYPGGGALPNGTEQPNWLAFGHLIAAANARGAERVEFVTAAKAAADASCDVFLRVVATVTLAIVEPARRREQLLTEALIAASQIEADLPQAAVTALIAGDPATGILAPLVARFTQGAATPAEVIRIDVATREI